MKKSFTSFTDLDSVAIFCPCGASISGEGNCVFKFIKRHKKHTDGTRDDIITNDGMRMFAADSKRTRRYVYL